MANSMALRDEYNSRCLRVRSIRPPSSDEDEEMIHDLRHKIKSRPCRKYFECPTLGQGSTSTEGSVAACHSADRDDHLHGEVPELEGRLVQLDGLDTNNLPKVQGIVIQGVERHFCIYQVLDKYK